MHWYLHLRMLYRFENYHYSHSIQNENIFLRIYYYEYYLDPLTGDNLCIRLLFIYLILYIRTHKFLECNTNV